MTTKSTNIMLSNHLTIFAPYVRFVGLCTAWVKRTYPHKPGQTMTYYPLSDMSDLD